MNALSKKDIAALREGDIVYVRMVVRKPLGEFGTIHCRIHSEETWRSHYVPVFPEHIVGRDTSEAENKEIASRGDVRFTAARMSAYRSIPEVVVEQPERCD
jgi:hypothetical protein